MSHRTTRRGFLQATGAVAAAPGLAATGTSGESLSGVRGARRHKFVADQPTPNFFEGMLLGNGDLGVCVTVRPDALGLHIGKSDSWDIRVSEDHYRHVLPFPEFLDLWRRAGEEAKRQGKPKMIFLERQIDFLREYTERVRSSYAETWPRPWPCGIVWIHWDARKVRVVRQELDPSCGLLTVTLRYDDLRGAWRSFRVFCFVDWSTNLVSVSTDAEAPFLSVAYYPNLDAGAKLPAPDIDARATDSYAEFSAFQRFPATVPTAEQPDPPPTQSDSSFALSARLSGSWSVEGLEEGRAKLAQPAEGADTYTSYRQPPRIFLRGRRQQPFRLDLTVFTPRDRRDNLRFAAAETARLSEIPVNQLQDETAQGWSKFWSRSAVELEDKELERIWYRNQYFLACCLREGKVAPGLFGNWMSGKIGTAWHGDYHMNYNTQQIYWGVFSSNHVDQHLPYVELCENLLPMSESFAHEKFEMPGAFFPHSAYPVPSQTIAYPVPPWGYEVCETPWTVQSLWWQYLYTLDEDYLRRVYPMLQAAARFLTAYAKKGEDGKFHIIPSVSPENWGLTVDYRLNRDCIIDLALTEFLLDAVIEASGILGVDHEERPRWSELRANLTPYPTAEDTSGEVWTDVADGPPHHVYNVPCTLAPVFPAEQVGIGKGERQLGIARRSARVVRLEGGNDLVYQPLIRARLGMLDLAWFKRQVRYCTLPNGTAQDRVRRIGGRYRDTTNFDFMMRMGVWIENLSLPAVINECLLQSYTGVIRLFPNRNGLGRARFESLRAVGAFLVSASCDGSTVGPVKLLSEKGAEAKIANPWGRAQPRVTELRTGRAVAISREGDVIRFPTEPGNSYRVEPS